VTTVQLLVYTYTDLAVQRPASHTLALSVTGAARCRQEKTMQSCSWCRPDEM